MRVSLRLPACCLALALLGARASAQDPPVPAPAPIPPPAPAPAPAPSPAPTPPAPIPPPPRPIPKGPETPTSTAPLPAPPAPPPAPGPPPAPSPAPAPAAPATARGPRVEVDRLEHDYGTVAQHAEHKAEFRLRNGGDAPLHVTGIKSECGCAPAEISARELAPGATATLSVTFRTYTFVGPMTKRLVVTTDDPTRPTLEFLLRLDVAAGVVVHPANFSLGTVLVGTSPTSTMRVQWRDGVGTPFKILGVETAGLASKSAAPRFAVTPFEDGTWRGWEVTLSFAEPPPIGGIGGTALIRTDDPLVPRIQVLYGGSVTGRVQVSLARPSFGFLPEGKGGKLHVLVKPYDATVELGEVTASSRRGRVQVAVARDEAHAGQWILVIEVPADTAAGPLDDVVELKTAVAGEETTELVVSGTVSPKRT